MIFRILLSLISSTRHVIERTLVSEMNASNSHVVIGIALLCVVLLISPVIILLVRMMTRTLQVRQQVEEMEGKGKEGGVGCTRKSIQVKKEERWTSKEEEYDREYEERTDSNSPRGLDKNVC